MTPDSNADALLWDALELSTLGRFATAVLTPFVRAWRTSRAAAAWQHVQANWRALSVHTENETVGTVMIAAALVHLGLAALRQPVGYWWLIVPGTALMFGLTAVGLSRLGRSPR